jgi:hypothetical protein
MVFHMSVKDRRFFLGPEGKVYVLISVSEAGTIWPVVMPERMINLVFYSLKFEDYRPKTVSAA